MAKVQKIKDISHLPGGGRYSDTNGRPVVYVSVMSTVVWEDEEHDHGDTRWCCRPDTRSELSGIHVYADEGSYAPAYPVRASVKAGDTVFVVVVDYSTGDTFGNDDGMFVAAGVELTRERAEELAEAVRKANDSGAWDVEYDGWAYYCGSWTGYFECVNSIDVYEAEVL